MYSIASAGSTYAFTVTGGVERLAGAGVVKETVGEGAV